MKSVELLIKISAVVGDFDSDALQWLSVINTAAAGLAHAVRGDDPDSCGRGHGSTRAEACRAATDQDGTEAGQGFGYVATTQRPIELRRAPTRCSAAATSVPATCGRLLRSERTGTARVPARCARASTIRPAT